MEADGLSLDDKRQPVQENDIPDLLKVTVLEWVEGLYEERVYEGDSPIASPLLGDLTLSASQILEGR